MREAESERERESQSLFQRENGKMNKKRRRRDEKKFSFFLFDDEPLVDATAPLGLCGSS
jgi:hypothetical protein